MRCSGDFARQSFDRPIRDLRASTDPWVTADGCVSAGAIEAEHLPGVVVAEDLGVTAQADYPSKCLFGFVRTQVIFQLGIGSHARSEVSLALVQNVPDMISTLQLPLRQKSSKGSRE